MVESCLIEVGKNNASVFFFFFFFLGGGGGGGGEDEHNKNHNTNMKSPKRLKSNDFQSYP